MRETESNYLQNRFTNGGTTMLGWAMRGVTFVINLLLLTGFALLYSWLQQTRFQFPILERLRGALQILLTISFLGLFHLASILRIMASNNRKGLGWGYLAFQIGVLIFALTFCKSRWLFLSLSLVLMVWYWWLPNVQWSGYFFLANVGLMAITEKYGQKIIARPLLYYPFCFLFSAPFIWANYLSLDGIEAGWLWEIMASLIVFYLIWLIYYRLKERAAWQARLIQQASQDNLTQLSNFRVFSADLHQAFKDYQNNGTEYLLYTFDVDHFKWVNDHFGHLEGNEVLKRVAMELSLLLPKISSTAKAYRVGGEEFSFIIFDRQTQIGSVDTVANEVREAISQLRFTTKKGEQFQITISLGEDQVNAEYQNYLDVYRRADQRLYHSKETGRDRVTTVSEV